ncbi:MAG: DNA helicase [Leptolyngbya sp. PLA3]|nr:MAG: DEAD/DEAH box helicase [Cyanobacteria bacterium CYA]MCE7968378.1 DNA helicase [Leptolyngbya sp. PL-A3]
MQLRPYQRDAVDAVWNHIAASDTNPAVVLPTGSGKTHVIAELCRDAVQKWNGRVVVLAHVKELLEQAAGKLRAVAPDLPVGVFSAGLGRRDLGYAVTIAGIQSVYQRAHDLGPLDLVIVDEAHLIPPDGEGMYRRFLADARNLCDHQRVIGLTATPYRMKTGTICGPESVLHEVCFEAGVRELIVQGYLCPLKSRAGKAVADTSDIHVRGGEFVAGELEERMDEDGLVETACAEVITATSERSSVLLFCSGVRHGEHVVRVLAERHGVECGFVEGGTPAKERDALIDRFKRGDLKYLANVNVLTTGFDAPNVDCVAMLRPTMSPGLYYQMVGRGFRLAEGKTDCLVLDFGGNVLRHGPVDAIRLADPGTGGGEAPAKQCPECDALIHAAYAVCPECGHKFPPRQVKHAAVASDEAVVSGSEGPTRRDERVIEVAYYIHHKRNDPLAKPTMRVEYRLGFNRWAREWLCFEHPKGGYARRKAEQWWRQRSYDPAPSSVEDAVEWANAGVLAPTLRVTLEKKPGDEWERIVGCELGDKPPRLEDPDNLPEHALAALGHADDDSIPF